MCLNPITVMVKGLPQKRACRKCNQCRDNYVRDWVGRNVAESKLSAGSTLITLTYGDSNDLGAATLIYKDVQDYLKRVRKSGYEVRFFGVGEYGSKKGRSHWHMLMHWQNRVPNYMEGRTEWRDRWWHKGNVQWDTFTPQTAAYVCKYLMKDHSRNSPQQVSGPHMSTRPALGSSFFFRLAEKYAVQRLLPLDAGYSFPECLWRGERRKFMLRGAARTQFAQAIVDCWEDINGEHPLQRQHSEWLEAELDKLARPMASDQIERRGFVRSPWLPPPEGAGAVFFSEPHNNWACDYKGRRLFWSYDSEGLRAWRDVIVTASEAERSRAASALARSPDEYRRVSDGW